MVSCHRYGSQLYMNILIIPFFLVTFVSRERIAEFFAKSTSTVNLYVNEDKTLQRESTSRLVFKNKAKLDRHFLHKDKKAFYKKNYHFFLHVCLATFNNNVLIDNCGSASFDVMYCCITMHIYENYTVKS